MKIILSRKGFDSSYGGFASPILEDGRMISLPIPIIHKSEEIFKYCDLSPLGVNLGALLKELGKEAKVNGVKADYVHFDPDLYSDALPQDNSFNARLEGWRGLFGTDQVAASVLNNPKTGVAKGDIFLFFGWFNHTNKTEDGKRVYDNKCDGFHQIWGWLQIDRIIHLNNEEERASVPEWAKYHSHYQNQDMRNNTLFLASENLTIDGSDQTGIKGYGTINHFNESATLTEMSPGTNNEYFYKYRKEVDPNSLTGKDIKKSLWRLPHWFHHDDITKRLGYHNDNSDKTKNRWNKEGLYAYLRSTSPAQEFILDLEHYPEEAKQWVLDIINCDVKHGGTEG